MCFLYHYSRTEAVEGKKCFNVTHRSQNSDNAKKSTTVSELKEEWEVAEKKSK